MADYCDRLGWVDEEQDDDNPCVCILPPGHEGLHECGEGCGSSWAGGVAPEPDGSGT